MIYEITKMRRLKEIIYLETREMANYMYLCTSKRTNTETTQSNTFGGTFLSLSVGSTRLSIIGGDDSTFETVSSIQFMPFAIILHTQ